MRTYKLTIAYDGTRYRGWQRQNHTDATIQTILERTLCGMTGYPVEANGSGRTDGGVHAGGQTASIILSGMVEIPLFQKELNEKLPEDIKVVGMELMKNGFHARLQASGKRYVYTVDTRMKPSVFLRRYAYHYPKHLDIEAMEAAAQILVGKHDFAGFTDKKYQKTTVRTIHSIELEAQGSFLRIVYEGTGFLYHMVRILTGTLLEVGSGERSLHSVESLLENKLRTEAGFLAPGKGLCLEKVYY
ncbi:MAG: tRNA pseudouridine(38-40) synthase TruA [Hespellia sp.]|nr:tRNA pseudouridine(38-40) synthase TruA [Hespellia sp.]